MRHIVVQVRERDPVLRPNRLPDDNLVDVIELIPVLVAHVAVLDQWLELGSSRNSHVQCLGCEEALRIKQVEEVAVHQIGQQLIRQSVERRDLGQCEVPLAVRGPVDVTVNEEEDGALY